MEAFLEWFFRVSSCFSSSRGNGNGVDDSGNTVAATYVCWTTTNKIRDNPYMKLKMVSETNEMLCVCVCVRATRMGKNKERNNTDRQTNRRTGWKERNGKIETRVFG